MLLQRTLRVLYPHVRSESTLQRTRSIAVSVRSKWHGSFNARCGYRSNYSSGAVAALALSVGGIALISPAFADYGIDKAVGVGVGESPEDDRALGKLSKEEPLSGVSFPTSLSPSEHLIGASCRLMQQLVKVYAVALYVDTDTTATALLKWQRFSTEDMCNAEPFWQRLCEGTIPKTFRIVVVRQVSGSHMGSGFERALLPRAAKRSAEIGGRSPSEVRADVKEFCRAFSRVGNMKQGSTVSIRIQNNRVELVVDERVLSVISDPCLSWAIADMYLGEKSVVRSFRAEVVDELAKLLRHH